MEILSTDKFMELLNGYETLKNFLFDETNKKNFMEISDINRITESLNFGPEVVEVIKLFPANEMKEVKPKELINQRIMKDMIDMLDKHY